MGRLTDGLIQYDYLLVGIEPTVCIRCHKPFYNPKIRAAVRCPKCCAAVSNHLSKSLRSRVFKRDGFICNICGFPTFDQVSVLRSGAVAPLSPTVDHLVPIVLGGENAMENLACAHFKCNCERVPGTVWK